MLKHQGFFMLTIEHIQRNSLNDIQFNQLYDIIIDAYARTEKEVWGENYIRISKADFQHHIDAEEIIIARIEEEIVGGIRVFQLGEGIWSFSLLGAARTASGKGVGRSLIQAAEGVAKAHGAEIMRIEVLRADNISVESKVILHNWYERLGYAFVKSVDVFEVYDDAEKWAKLVNPSIFDCYQKTI